MPFYKPKIDHGQSLVIAKFTVVVILIVNHAAMLRITCGSIHLRFLYLSNFFLQEFISESRYKPSGKRMDGRINADGSVIRIYQ